MDAFYESHFALGESWMHEPLCEEYDPRELFYVEGINLDEYLHEDGETTKKNILQKLWGLIKKCAAFVKKCVMTIVNGVKKLFGHKSTKSGSDIAQMAGLSANNSVSMPPPADKVALDKQFATDAVSSMIGSLIHDVDNGQFSILIPGDLVNMDPNDPNIAVKGKEINGAWARARNVVALIQDDTPLKAYKSFFQTLTNEFGKGVVNEADVEKIWSICKDFSGRSSVEDYIRDGVAQKLPKYAKKAKALPLIGGLVPSDMTHVRGGDVRGEMADVTITMNQLMEFQQLVDEICQLGEKYDVYFDELNVNNAGKFRENKKFNEAKKSYIEILNDLAWACVELQGGLHAIANGLRGVYEVGIQYYEQVDDPNRLAEFINQAIIHGMPAKYVVRNIYNVCTEKIKGKPNLDKPIMGFGRLTLIPEGPIIYKCAINRYGIRSNRNDFLVMDAVRGTKDAKLASMFANTTKSYGEYAVNVMEKVQAGKKYEPSEGKAKELGKAINGKFEDLGINFIINDIKADAFGQKNGKYVILDYGYIIRRSWKGQDRYQQAPYKSGTSPDLDGINDVHDSDTKRREEEFGGVQDIPGIGRVKMAV